jgi:aspartate/glutamate/glutamine transport system substrate-binding protein
VDSIPDLAVGRERHMLVMQRASDAGSLVAERMSKPEFELGTSMRRFQDSGVVRVGVVTDAPGFSSRNFDTGRFEGLDIAVARKLVQSIFGGTLFMANRNIEFVELALSGRTTALAEHTVDFVTSVFIPTDERREFVDFTDPYYGTAIGLVSRYDSPIASIEDLGMASIALVPTTVDERVVQSMKLSSRIVECLGNDDTIKTVLAGGADLGVMSAALLDSYVAHNMDLKRLPFVLDTFPYAVGVQKGDEALQSFLNVQIGELLRQGYVSLAEMVRRRDI